MIEPYPDQEFTAFMDRVRRAFRRSTGRRFVERNRFVLTPAETRVRNYDAHTGRLLEQLERGI